MPHSRYLAKTTAIADLSLRQLARDVGVSATAVYRHFPDKQALMRALASEGIEQLGQFQQPMARPIQPMPLLPPAAPMFASPSPIPHCSG